MRESRGMIVRLDPPEIVIESDGRWLYNLKVFFF